MPIERLALRGCSSMSKPQIVALPLGFGDQPGEDVDQRRLARAIGPEQAEDLPARHVEADIVERALGPPWRRSCDRDSMRIAGSAAHAPQRIGARPIATSRMVNAPFTLTARVILTLTLYRDGQ